MSGRNAGDEVIVTAMLDRIERVERLVNVLPQFVSFFHNKAELATKWFHPQCNTGNASFETDDDSNWTGEWTTKDDASKRMIIDEDMGIYFYLEELESLENRPRRLLDSDAMSVRTCGMSKLAPLVIHQHADSDLDPAAAAPSVASGGSGHTHWFPASTCVAATRR